MKHNISYSILIFLYFFVFLCGSTIILYFFILLVGRIFSLSQIELNFNLQSTTYSSSNSLWIIIYCNLNYDVIIRIFILQRNKIYNSFSLIFMDQLMHHNFRDQRYPSISEILRSAVKSSRKIWSSCNT